MPDRNGDGTSLGDWRFVQEYKCPNCGDRYSVGFLRQDDIFPLVECECGSDMLKVDLDPPPTT